MFLRYSYFCINNCVKHNLFGVNSAISSSHGCNHSLNGYLFFT